MSTALRAVTAAIAMGLLGGLVQLTAETAWPSPTASSSALPEPDWLPAGFDAERLEPGVWGVGGDGRRRLGTTWDELEGASGTPWCNGAGHPPSMLARGSLLRL